MATNTPGTLLRRSSLAYRIALTLLIFAFSHQLLVLSHAWVLLLLIPFASRTLIAALLALTGYAFAFTLVTGTPLSPPAHALATGAILLAATLCGRVTFFDDFKDRALPEGYFHAARAGRWLALAMTSLYLLALLMRGVSQVEMLGYAAASSFLGYALARLPHPYQRPDHAGRILIAAVTLFCILFLEVACRLFLPRPEMPPDLHSPHPETVHALTPNIAIPLNFPTTDIADALEVPIRVNSLGLRGPDVPMPKPANEFRIACIGDSYTFGWGGLEENGYPSQLEALLAQAFPDRTIRVINAGTGAFAPWQERIVLNRKVLPLQPDLVVLQTFAANDLAETLLNQGRMLDAYSQEWLDLMSGYRLADTWAFRFNRYLRRSSSLYFRIEHHLLRDWLVVRAYKRSRLSATRALPDLLPSADRLWIAEPDLREWYPALRDGFAAVAADIEGIQKDCAAHGIPLLAFNIPWAPAMMHIQPNVLTSQMHLYDPGKGAREMESLLARTAPYHVPMLDAFLAAPNLTTITYNRDGHFTREGNTLLATRLRDALLPVLKGELSTAHP